MTLSIRRQRQMCRRDKVGPMMNFGGFSNPAKLVMIFDMLAGRLEIFPMLVLFLPDTWRKF